MSQTDIVIGLQYGDEGKGKIVNYLASKNTYDYCIRYNGGANAGHTIYIDGIKFVTHQIPTGYLYGINSIIADNCYLDVDKLINEIKYIKDNGNEDILNRLKTLYVSENCHLITSKHKGEDDLNGKIGTTKSGIGPCARDKYARVGIRVKDSQEAIDILADNDIQIIDTTEFLLNAEHLINSYDEDNTNEMNKVSHKNHTNHTKNHLSYLVEGAQGYGLDISHGDFPYCTSSHCISTDCFNIGIPFRQTDNYKVNIYGIAKLYETYVGNKVFQDPDNVELQNIQKEGHEFGSTTERPRQCNYLNLNYLLKSIWVNQCNIVYINKCDILDTLKYYKLYWGNKLKTFENIKQMEEFVTDKLEQYAHIKKNNIIFEYSPYLTHVIQNKDE